MARRLELVKTQRRLAEPRKTPTASTDPRDELNAIRFEIADNVASAMLDSELRDRAASPGRSISGASLSKPIPQ